MRSTLILQIYLLPAECEVKPFTRYLQLVTFYSLLVTFYYILLVTPYFLLVTRCFLLVTCYFLLAIRYFLFVTHYFLLAVRCFLLVTFYPLHFTRYILPVTLLVATYWVLITFYSYGIALYSQCSHYIIHQFMKKKIQTLLDGFLWSVDIV